MKINYNRSSKLGLIALLVILLFSPLYVQAAFDDVVFESDVTVNLSGPNYDLTILAGGEVGGYTVGTTTLSFDLSSGSSVTVRSSDRLDLINDGGFNVSCGESYSQLELTSSVTQTIVITPTGTCSSSSGSSGGGGGGGPATPATPKNDVHSLGTNIKDSSGTVFTITSSENGATIRRPYTSWGAYLSYGFNTEANIVPANTADLALPVGSFIPPQDGRVICSDRGADQGTCYFMTQGQKAGFVSEAVFNGLGFSFNNVFQGDVSFMSSASNITSPTQQHLPGTVVNNAGTIQLVGSNGLMGFPSWDVFLSWGYDNIMVVPSNAADTALTQSSVIPSRSAGQIRLSY